MELIHFNKAKQELSIATKIDEVKEVRDKAEALRAYAKQSNESLEMQNQCAEIKIRAERRAGELLKDQKKATGADYGGKPSLDGKRVLPSNPPPITDLPSLIRLARRSLDCFCAFSRRLRAIISLVAMTTSFYTYGRLV